MRSALLHSGNSRQTAQNNLFQNRESRTPPGWRFSRRIIAHVNARRRRQTQNNEAGVN